jgi:hypothetical protein
MYAANSGLGSARVSSRACGSERVLAIANFSSDSILLTEAETEAKDCFGATPKPARETRALPEGVNR